MAWERPPQMQGQECVSAQGQLRSQDTDSGFWGADPGKLEIKLVGGQLMSSPASWAWGTGDRRVSAFPVLIWEQSRAQNYREQDPLAPISRGALSQTQPVCKR